MPKTLTEVMTPTKLAEGRYAIEIPEGWHQGRATFGGLVLGVLVNTAIDHERDAERAFRAMTSEIVGPVPVGPAELEVSILRRGTGMTNLEVVLSSGGERLARATVVLGKTRVAGSATNPAPPPDGLGWKDVVAIPIAAPIGPEFAQHFEFRPRSGLPFTGAADARVEGFVRARAPLAAIGAAEVVAFADAWWPSLLAQETGPRPIGTITFMLEAFRPAAPLDPSIPLHYQANTIAARDGFLVELRELYTTAGELVALNQQTIAIIK